MADKQQIEEMEVLSDPAIPGLRFAPEVSVLIRQLFKESFAEQKSETETMIASKVAPCEADLANLTVTVNENKINQCKTNDDVETRLSKLEELTKAQQEDITLVDQKTTFLAYNATNSEDRQRSNNLRFTHMKLPGRTFQICKDYIVEFLYRAIQFRPNSIDKAHPVGGNNLDDVTLIVHLYRFEEKHTILRNSKKYEDYCYKIGLISKINEDVSNATLDNRSTLVNWARSLKFKNFKLRKNKLCYEQKQFEMYGGDVYNADTYENITNGVLPPPQPPSPTHPRRNSNNNRRNNNRNNQRKAPYSDRNRRGDNSGYNNVAIANSGAPSSAQAGPLLLPPNYTQSNLNALSNSQQLMPPGTFSNPTNVSQFSPSQTPLLHSMIQYQRNLQQLQRSNSQNNLHLQMMNLSLANQHHLRQTGAGLDDPYLSYAGTGRYLPY